MFAFAEYEADMIAERTSEGKAEKKATDPDYKGGRKVIDVPDFKKYFEKTKKGCLLQPCVVRSSASAAPSGIVYVKGHKGD